MKGFIHKVWKFVRARAVGAGKGSNSREEESWLGI